MRSGRLPASVAGYASGKAMRGRGSWESRDVGGEQEDEGMRLGALERSFEVAELRRREGRRAVDRRLERLDLGALDHRDRSGRSVASYEPNLIGNFR